MKKKNKGFTLIELIVTVAIIAIFYLNEKLNSGFGPNARVNSI